MRRLLPVVIATLLSAGPALSGMSGQVFQGIPDRFPVYRPFQTTAPRDVPFQTPDATGPLMANDPALQSHDGLPLNAPQGSFVQALSALPGAVPPNGTALPLPPGPGMEVFALDAKGHSKPAAQMLAMPDQIRMTLPASLPSLPGAGTGVVSTAPLRLPGPDATVLPLPPLPGQGGSLAGQSQNGPLSGPPGPPGQSVLPSPEQNDDNGSLAHWKDLFQTQADSLTATMGTHLRSIVVDTDDPAMHDFIWKGMMRRPEAAESQESGLAGLFIDGGQVNGQTQPMCYVLYRHDKAGSTQRQFLAPLTRMYGEKVAAAFLIGHETGHCMDFMERQNAMAGQPSWTSQDAATVGISDVAFARVFGAMVNEASYQGSFLTLEHDLAQRQFEERVGDILGVFWAWTQGMPKEGVDVIRETRKYQTGLGTHNTLGALDGLEGFYDEAMKANGNLPALWQIARRIQLQKGVTPEAVAWTPQPAAVNPDEVNSAALNGQARKGAGGSAPANSPTVMSMAPTGPKVFGTSKPVGTLSNVPTNTPISGQGPTNFSNLPHFGR
jgi:hypothetical protein